MILGQCSGVAIGSYIMADELKLWHEEVAFLQFQSDTILEINPKVAFQIKQGEGETCGAYVHIVNDDADL